MSVAAPRRVLLIGGSSEIGLAIVRRLAQDTPVRPFLLGRGAAQLSASLASLGGESVGEIDLLDADAFDVVIVAVGLLGAQEGLDADPVLANDVMRVNFVGCGSLLLAAMRSLRAQSRPGTVVVLSSVAAERPRAGNAIYGAAKAGFDALAQGLADATVATGPRVLVVRPGFVHTRMTAGLPAAPFSTSADAVAEATVRGLAGRAHTVWVPGVLRFIFAILRHLPRQIYRRLPL